MVECRQDAQDRIAALLTAGDIPHAVIGRTTVAKQIRVHCNGELVLDEEDAAAAPVVGGDQLSVGEAADESGLCRRGKGKYC